MASTLQKKYLDADIQAMLELGFMDSNLQLNSSGIRMICEYIFDAHKKAIGKIAQDLLAEQKKRRDECDEC